VICESRVKPPCWSWLREESQCELFPGWPHTGVAKRSSAIALAPSSREVKTAQGWLLALLSPAIAAQLVRGAPGRRKRRAPHLVGHRLFGPRACSKTGPVLGSVADLPAEDPNARPYARS